MVRNEFLVFLQACCLAGLCLGRMFPVRESMRKSGGKLESLHETRGANICLMVHKQPRSKHQSFKIPVAANSCGFTVYFSESS